MISNSTGITNKLAFEIEKKKTELPILNILIRTETINISYSITATILRKTTSTNK